MDSAMLAQKTRYALRSLLFLVEEGRGAPVQLARIAATQQVPPKYLELIMVGLKKAGLVTSTPRAARRLCPRSRSGRTFPSARLSG